MKNGVNCVEMPVATAEGRTTPLAAVMCGGGGGAYDMVRMLAMAGVPSLVFASHADDVALRSRHVRGSLLLPEFREWNFAEILVRVGARGAALAERVPLFYMGDSEVAFVSRYADELRCWFRFVLPPPSIVDAVTSKTRFAEFARQADLPVPTTAIFADEAQLASALDTIAFPCIVKPACNADWFWETDDLRRRFGDYKSALRRFDSAAELRTFCSGLPVRPGGFVVQSYIAGAEDCLVSFHGYFDERSRCLGSFLTREIRTDPPSTGESTSCETFRNDELSRSTQDYLARISFRGIVKVDYKWHADSRTYKMLEIEPHYQTAHLLGAQAGVNLAQIAYRDLCGSVSLARRNVEAIRRGDEMAAGAACETNVRLIDLRRDIKAYWRAYRNAGACSPLRYAQSILVGRNHYRLYDPCDRRPLLYAILRHLRGMLRARCGRLARAATLRSGVTQIAQDSYAQRTR